MTRLSQMNKRRDFEIEHERETLRERRDRRHRRNLSTIALVVLALAISAAWIILACKGSLVASLGPLGIVPMLISSRAF
jgi:hypothetical protein